MSRILILVFCVYALPAPAETLGRLFYTPEQRAMLDLARKTAPLNTSGEADANGAQGFMVNGVVTRSDGQRSTWVNGHLEQSVARPGKHDRSQAHVKLPGGEIKLKVGQSFNPATGRVEEGYRRAPLPTLPEPATAKPALPKFPAKASVPDTHDDNAEPEPARQ
jgi:hypothetical protein